MSRGCDESRDLPRHGSDCGGGSGAPGLAAAHPPIRLDHIPASVVILIARAAHAPAITTAEAAAWPLHVFGPSALTTTETQPWHGEALEAPWPSKQRESEAPVVGSANCFATRCQGCPVRRWEELESGFPTTGSTITAFSKSQLPARSQSPRAPPLLESWRSLSAWRYRSPTHRRSGRWRCRACGRRA